MITAFAAGAVNGAAVADAAARRAAELFGDMCIVTRLTRDRRHLAVVALHHAESAVVDDTRNRFALRPYPADRGPAGRVIASARPLLMTADAPDLEEADRAYMERFRIRSWILAPLRIHGRVLGTFGIWRGDGRPGYTRRDVELVTRLADAVAVVVGAEELMLETERAVDRVHRLALTAAAVAEGRAPRVTLAMLVDQLRHEDGIDAAQVLLLDGAAAVTVAASAGLQNVRRLAGTRRPLSAAAREAVESGREVELRGNEAGLALPAGARVAATIVIPLFAGGEPVGVLELYTRDGPELEAGARRFVDAMAALAVTAIGASPTRRPGAVAKAPPLNTSQRAVLELLVAGRSNREIAEAVHLSENTVKFHVSELLRKAGARNRVELVQAAGRFQRG